jgi:hypothetical protein
MIVFPSEIFLMLMSVIVLALVARIDLEILFARESP